MQNWPQCAHLIERLRVTFLGLSVRKLEAWGCTGPEATPLARQGAPTLHHPMHAYNVFRTV